MQKPRNAREKGTPTRLGYEQVIMLVSACASAKMKRKDSQLNDLMSSSGVAEENPAQKTNLI